MSQEKDLKYDTIKIFSEIHESHVSPLHKLYIMYTL